MRSKSISVLLLGMALAATPLLGQQRDRNNLRPDPQPKQQEPGEREGAENPNRGLHGPGPHAGDWLRRYKNLPPDQQQRMLQGDANFRNLPPDKQQKLINRLEWFNRQSPDQQQRILQRMETWEHLAPEQRQQASSIFERFRQLPEERRQRIHQAINRLSRMDVAERQKEMASEEFRSNFSEQEREMINRALSLGVPPGRMKDGPDDDRAQRPVRPRE